MLPELHCQALLRESMTGQHEQEEGAEARALKRWRTSLELDKTQLGLQQQQLALDKACWAFECEKKQAAK